MNNYEKSQYEAIKKWKSEEPSVVSQALGDSDGIKTLPESQYTF